MSHGKPCPSSGLVMYQKTPKTNMCLHPVTVETIHLDQYSKLLSYYIRGTRLVEIVFPTKQNVRLRSGILQIPVYWDAVMQSQKAASAYFTSEHILPSGFVD